MTTSSVRGLEQTGLNTVLFAPIGTEANGMTLSVISALARRGTDPWGEAGRLAGLSKSAAIESLTHTIADMPDSPWNLTDAAPIAARLVALLPGAPQSAPMQAASNAIGWRIDFRTIAIALALALGLGYAAMMLMQDRKAPGAERTLNTAPSTEILR